MKRSVLLWQLGGLVFTSALGTLLHFLYEWTGAIFLKPISAINESTWEHMKILYFPMLFYAIFQSFFFKKYYPNFWWAKCLGFLIGLILIPIIFYTYNGAIGKSPDWLNITIFFISAGLAYFIEGVFLYHNKPNWTGKFLPIIIISLIGVLFIIFTFSAPNLPIFIDPTK